jgi:hypothetical protein
LHIGPFRRAKANIATLARNIGVVALLTIVSVLPSVAAAQESSVPSYDVELVIFLHLSSDATDEVWNLESAVGEPPAIPSDDASPFESTAPTSSTAPAPNFPALPASKFKLTAIEEALRRSRNYRPIAHIGWTQPGFARNGAPFLSLDAFVPASSGLTGQVALSRGRYLHLTLDLSYTGSDSQRYVLRQSRRMRSNERHYIDHPKFGVIAVVTPSDSQ